MSAPRRFQASLFLMLLQLNAVPAEYSSFVVSDGDEVALPCGNAMSEQSQCENTTWLFSGSGNTPEVELVRFGQIVEKARRKPSVTADCSLVIKTVTGEDVGRYTCRQFSTTGQRQDAMVYLSVATLDEYQNGKVTLSCSVSTFGWCTQRVKWLFKGRDVGNRVRGVKESRDYCSASVTFTTSHSMHPSTYGFFTCEVTDRESGKVKLFAFSSRLSGEDATTVSPKEQSTKAGPANGDPTNPQGWQRDIIGCVGLAALIVTVVAVNIWTKYKGNKTQMEDNIEHNDEGDGTPSFENVGHLYSSARHH